MNLIFRVDSSLEIGAGHLMRCLTLADQFCKNGYEIHFVYQTMLERYKNAIKLRGYKYTKLFISRNQNKSLNNLKIEDECSQIIELLKVDDSILVVDSYLIDNKWHLKVKPFTKCLVVIDDLADRSYKCDILVDQTYARKLSDYQLYVTKETKLLLGTKYVILRDEFIFSRSNAVERRRSYAGIKKILVSMGGTDPNNLTASVLEKIDKTCSKNNILVDIIVSRESPYIKKIKRQLSKKNFSYHLIEDTDNISELMLNADLAIGCAGGSTWERCFMLLPSLVIAEDKNQQIVQEHIQKTGSIFVVDNMDLLEVSLTSIVDRFNKSPSEYWKVIKILKEIVDEKGASRIVKSITKHLQNNN